MKMLTKIYGGILLLGAIGTTAPAIAAEHWDVYQPASTPWTAMRAVTVFQGNLYVGADKADQLLHVWKSSDGDRWQELLTPVPPLESYVQGFETFQNSLFMFVVSSAPAPSFGILSILKSDDGATWTIVNRFSSFGMGVWSDSRVFNSRLYAANTSGELLSTADGTNWTNPAPQLFPRITNQRTPLSLAEYHDNLYIAKVTDETFLTQTTVYRTSDGVSFEQINAQPAQGEMLRSGTAVFDDALYWAGLFLERVRPSGTTFQWTQEVAGNAPFPFLLGGKLHAAGLPSQVLQMSATGDWQSVFQENSNSCTAATPRSSRAVTLSGSTYIAPCNLMRFRAGVYAATVNSTEQTLARSQSRVPFASFHFDVNDTDTLTAISVTNTGTAQAGVDIDHVAIFKSDNGQPGQQLQELTASSDGRTWQSPPGPLAALVDGDELIVAGDITDHATSGATIRLSAPVNALSFSVNSPYHTPAPLTAPKAQTIMVADSIAVAAPAVGLTAFPSPARESLRFLYALAETSDVEIELYDRRGTRVLSSRESSKPANPRAVSIMDCASLSTGIYYAVLKIHGSDTRILKTKVAIER
jgi:hypothetical protein